jgi:hypothetical protein
MATYLTSNIFSDINISGNCTIQGSMSSGNPVMFRNKLYNGNFQIWQRNTTFTGIGTNTYTADRWATPINAGAGSTLTVSRSTSVPSGAGFNYSLQIVTAATSGAPSLIEQRVEAVNASDLVNGTYVTVSFWAIQTSPASFITLNTQILYPSTTDTWTAQNNAGSPSVVGNTLTGSWAYYRATFQVNTALVATNGLSVQFWAAAITASTTILITGVQLERGQVATPFEVRPYAIELQMCQRYYYQWNSTFAYGVLGYATAINSANAILAVPFPVQMRAAVSSYGNFSSSAFSAFSTQGPSWGTFSAISTVTDGNSLNMGQIILTFSAATTGQSIQVRANGSTTAYVAWNAEL